MSTASSLQECVPFPAVTDIIGRPNEHLVAEACDKEITKLFDMGTFSHQKNILVTQ